MYLDPGSGSVILQVVLAAILGIGVFVKIYWGKIKSLFRFGQSENQTKSIDTSDSKRD